MFELAMQLAEDSHLVCDLPLCRVLLMNDSQYPWLIAVPMRNNIKEIIELNEQDERELWRESRLLSRCLQALFDPDKLNIAALGNQVSQLHVHHIARYRQDAAWPKPVWGVHAPKAYQPEQAQQRVEQIRHYLVKETP